MQNVTLSISGMTCGHCVASVRQALQAVPGADVRAVTLGAAEIALADSTPPDALVAAVEDAGYDAALVATAVASAATTSGCSCCAPAPAMLSRSSAGRSGNACH